MSVPVQSKVYTCSFCGKPHTEVARFIGGPGGIYICSECIDLSYAIVHENAKTPQEFEAICECHEATYCRPSEDASE